MAEKLSATVVIFIRVIEVLLLLRIVTSYIPMRKGNQLRAFLQMATEPILAPIRHMISRSTIGDKLMFDISPILAYFLLTFVEYILLLLVGKLFG